MFRFKLGALCAILFTAVTATGCASSAKSEQISNIELQRNAMQRWNHCLERHSHSDTMTAMKISQLLEHNCEGHKRDVIAVFPRHMSKQIDQMLISSAYQLLESDNASVELSPQQGELIQTLLR